MTVVWTARVVPLKTGADRWTSDDFTVARERPWKIPVLVGHDAALQVGRLHEIRERAGWIEADFILDDTQVGREAAEHMRIGQPVSIGARELTGTVPLRWARELSLVQRGAIRGAEIIGRRELRPTTAPTPTAARATAGNWGPGAIVRDMPDGTQEITFPRAGPRFRREFKPPTITVR
jgi:hypothetical protein